MFLIKKNYLKICFLILVACNTLIITCRAENQDQSLMGGIRDHIENLVSTQQIPSMAVAVARSGEILWEEGFGFSDLEKKISATEHTLFPLASVAKPITATALMILVDREILHLDKPISAYLGDIKLTDDKERSEKITLRGIASHTAGLPLHSNHYYSNEDDFPRSFSETISRYGRIVSEPGERFQYSNLGYGIIGEIIAQNSLKDYWDFLLEEILTPLKLNEISIGASKNIDDYAVKYTPKGEIVAPSVSDSPAAGDIYGSVHDLIRFLMIHTGTPSNNVSSIISDQSITEMQKAVSGTGPVRFWHREGSGYGIGWNIGITSTGLKLVYHNGGILGARSIAAIVPEEDIAAAVLTNTDSSKAEAVLVQILGALLPEHADSFNIDKPGKYSKGELLLSGYVGQWQGSVLTHTGNVSIGLEVDPEFNIFISLGGSIRESLKNLSYEKDFPLFLNSGRKAYLRGWFKGQLETEDVLRGAPTKFWLEVKIKGDTLSGVVIAFSQRKNPTGPLSHPVELSRVE